MNNHFYFPFALAAGVITGFVLDYNHTPYGAIGMTTVCLIVAYFAGYHSGKAD